MKEKKTIIVIHKNSINNEPPTQTIIQLLNDLGYRVILITLSINDYWKDELNRREIIYYNFNEDKFTTYSRRGIFKKLQIWIKYRNLVLNILSNESHSSILWFVNADSFAPLVYSSIFQKFQYILHILETYDNSRFYRSIIKKYINNSYSSVVCEENRAAIFNVWFKLKKYPIVLPNKPYSLPNVNDSYKFIRLNYGKLCEIIDNGGKIILYQGIISKDRSLLPFIKAINNLGSEYVLVIMGKDYGPLKEYRKHCSKFIYIPYIDSPQHLFITSKAFIGILIYDPISLNQIFCAPNKLFEFGGYSIPMLGNNIPGLSLPFKKYRAGEVCDTNSVASIENAIKLINSKINEYKVGAKELYDSVNLKCIINMIVE